MLFFLRKCLLQYQSSARLRICHALICCHITHRKLQWEGENERNDQFDRAEATAKSCPAWQLAIVPYQCQWSTVWERIEGICKSWCWKSDFVGILANWHSILLHLLHIFVCKRQSPNQICHNTSCGRKHTFYETHSAQAWLSAAGNSLRKKYKICWHRLLWMIHGGAELALETCLEVCLLNPPSSLRQGSSTQLSFEQSILSKFSSPEDRKSAALRQEVCSACKALSEFSARCTLRKCYTHWALLKRTISGKALCCGISDSWA